MNELLASAGVSPKTAKEDAPTIPDKTEEAANRIAEKLAAATLNDDEKQQEKKDD